MKDQKPVDIVDPTLTPQNARERGYQYIDDVIYVPAAPSLDILELLQAHGHKMGKPSSQNNYESYAGIYAPMRTNSNK